jgi:hypothetical protein
MGLRLRLPPNRMPFLSKFKKTLSFTGQRGSLSGLCLAVIVSIGVAIGLTACENVASYSQPSLVRVIDASYIAPAVNVKVENTVLAYNIGQGTITPYGTLAADVNAAIDVTAATGGATLINTNGTLLAGHQHTVFLTDNGAAPNSYEVTVLEDQQVAAAGGHSAFRFLNQAPKTGAVDVYMVPSGTTLANTIPIVTGLAVGATAGYISFNSQTVTMVITPTGLLTPKYTSASLALTGGEVRTVLLVDTQLVSNPPIQAYMANDVD